MLMSIMTELQHIIQCRGEDVEEDIHIYIAYYPKSGKTD